MSTDLGKRKFIKQLLIGGGGTVIGAAAVKNLLLSELNAAHNDPSAAAAELGKFAREAKYYEPNKHGIGAVKCVLCPHGCDVDDGERGRCRTRQAHHGRLYTMAYGNACSAYVDPIEKKPLNHFLPGTNILSIATGGCNLRCPNCQNWEISQSRPEDVARYDLPPQKVIALSRVKQVPSIAYTYSDPLAYYEYAYDTAALAHEQGIKNVLVTAGYYNQEPLRDISRYIDAVHVDLKSFSDYFYKEVPHARLKPVLDTIVTLKSLGVWVELIHLTIPTLSDDLKEIKDMCKWVVNAVGDDTPVHFSRFHPAHKMLQLPPTSADTLVNAHDTALAAGLHYVYIGNILLDKGQHTYCPSCKQPVIERRGYTVTANRLQGGHCPCGNKIAGVWQ
ncbi:MAG: AmmeMemoRadiSam system radical SAM enzyme [Deltaproteobacteria bacterium]|nr:AmmeMemoRadiSam system radical SAM enzyme [Deltaproteobacteria bacterium]